MAGNNSDAEKIFRKSEDEMSDIERMMADILNEYSQESKAAKEEAAPEEKEVKPAYAAPVPPVKTKRNTSAYVPETPKAAAPAPEEEAPSAAYRQNQKAEREKNIKAASRKRSAGPAIAALVLIAVFVIGALVYSKMFEDIQETRAANEVYEEDIPTEEEAQALAAVTFPPDMVIPTPEPEDAVAEGTLKVEAPSASVVIMSETRQEDITHEHSYSFHTEDVSWTQAQQRCAEMGGHLAVVSSESELNDIITLAAENGIEKVWLGCHRENNELVWENGEQVEFYAWGKGEPSYYDGGDKVAEDYLLLWHFNGAWVYNDSRDDPVRDYPDMYSGQIGYVCEID